MKVNNSLCALGREKVARAICRENNNIPCTLVDGKSAPRSTGSHHWFRWRGRWKSAPGSYQRSTRAVEVGRDWDIRAPRGMTWRWDPGVGPMLVRLTDGMDYHPTADDFRARDFCRRVRRAMAANYSARMESRRVLHAADASNKRLAKAAVRVAWERETLVSI